MSNVLRGRVSGFIAVGGWGGEGPHLAKRKANQLDTHPQATIEHLPSVADGHLGVKCTKGKGVRVYSGGGGGGEGPHLAKRKANQLDTHPQGTILDKKC